MCATPPHGLSYKSTVSLHAWHLDFCDMQLENKCKGTDHHCLHTSFFFWDNRPVDCVKNQNWWCLYFYLPVNWAILFNQSSSWMKTFTISGWTSLGFMREPIRNVILLSLVSRMPRMTKQVWQRVFATTGFQYSHK